MVGVPTNGTALMIGGADATWQPLLDVWELCSAYFGPANTYIHRDTDRNALSHPDDHTHTRAHRACCSDTDVDRLAHVARLGRHIRYSHATIAKLDRCLRPGAGDLARQKIHGG